MSDTLVLKIDLGKKLNLRNLALFNNTYHDKVTSNQASSYVFIGGDLENIDTAALQQIYLYTKEITLNNSQFCWESVSDTLLEKATILGLHNKLVMPNNFD